ncbi:MAG: transketolase [Bacilli bacterium]|jgi:transketolase|nr:transketolase [Bacilli bacterium]
MEQLIVDTLRALAIDMTNKANSGHPGMALGSAPIGYTIFKNMKINPKNPTWFNRDRFVLASGHASSLLYGLLHISGYNLSLSDLEKFRQLHSLTPGHPEVNHTPGVDATSGPLGQGIPMAIGMALAEKVLANKYNTNEYELVDHYTYVLCGDGDMQEGVTSEACSLAGLWNLSKLIVFYDSNDITLDGTINDSFNEDIKARYEAYGWQYLKVSNGNDLDQLERALKMAQLENNKPSIIEVKTIIGYGSLKQGTNKVHGSPLGKEDGLQAKKSYGISEKEFYISNDIYDDYTLFKIKNGLKANKEWDKLVNDFKNIDLSLYDEFNDLINNKYEINFDELTYEKDVQATRNSSHDIINYIASKHPTFMGGSADLASSNMTKINDSTLFSSHNLLGRNINYGIREFAMAVINNGVMLHGGLKIFGSTFLVFSDYLKPALKMAALMKIPSIYVFTHDSIAVGEDGPTHQPIEHLAMLRAIPNVNVIRPCDAKETYMAWQMAMTSKETPTVIVLSRQNLPILNESSCENVKKGAYTLVGDNDCDLLLIATGSEVSLAYQAYQKLLEDNIKVKVISMPCMSVFEKQSRKYINEVIPPRIKKRLVIEMACSYGWHKYALKDNQILSIDNFGLSAPGNEVQEAFGFSVDNVVKMVKNIVK